MFYLQDVITILSYATLLLSNAAMTMSDATTKCSYATISPQPLKAILQPHLAMQQHQLSTPQPYPAWTQALFCIPEHGHAPLHLTSTPAHLAVQSVLYSIPFMPQTG